MTALYPPAGVAAHPPVDGDRLARIEAQLDRLVDASERRDAELQPLRDLAADVAALSGPVMRSVTDRVSTLDDRGYLAFARGTVGVLDRVVTSFGEDDVQALGDNIVLILETLRDLTQPEVMHLLQRAAVATQDAATVPEGPPPSTFALLRELRDPEVRRGLARMIDVLRTVGEDDTP